MERTKISITIDGKTHTERGIEMGESTLLRVDVQASAALQRTQTTQLTDSSIRAQLRALQTKVSSCKQGISLP